MLKAVVASAQDIEFQSIKIQRVKPVNFDWSLDDDKLIKLFKPFVVTDTQTLRPRLAALHYNRLFLAASDSHKLVFLPVPSNRRKKIGEPGTYLFPELHTPKRYIKIAEQLPEDELDANTKRIDDKYPNVTAVFPTYNNIKAKGSFSPYTLLTYIKAVEPYTHKKGYDFGIITRINGEKVALNPQYLAAILKFFLQLGFENLYFFKAGEEANNALVISVNRKLPAIYGSLEMKNLAASPRAPKINNNLSFHKDTAAVLMPKGGKETGEYGVYNSRDELYVKAYYDFSRDAIIDSEESDQKVNIYPFDKTSSNSRQTPISDRQAKIIKSITDKNKKNKPLQVLSKVLIKHRDLYANDLTTQYILPNISKPDGLYQLNGKSLAPEKDISVSGFPKNIKINQIGPATCEIEASKLLNLLELSHGIKELHRDGHNIFVEPFNFGGKNYTFVIGTDAYLLHMINVEAITEGVTNKIPYLPAYKTLRGIGLKNEKLSIHSVNDSESDRSAIKLPNSPDWLIYETPLQPHITTNKLRSLIKIGTETEYDTGLLVDKNKLYQSFEEGLAWINDEYEITWNYNANGDQFLYKIDNNELDELRTNSLGAVGEKKIPDLTDAEIIMAMAVKKSDQIVLPIVDITIYNIINALKKAPGKSVYIKRSSRTFTFYVVPDKQPKEPNFNPNVKKAKAKAQAQKQRIRLMAMAK